MTSRLDSEVADNGFPFSCPVLEVNQAIGKFFVAAIPASVLLDTCYSDRLTAKVDKQGVNYELAGAQRQILERRLLEIKEYIKTLESSFPNSIILAPNFRREDGLIETNRDLRWDISELDNCPDPRIARLTIPSKEYLCTIIDGQHRLFGFAELEPDDPRRNTELVCALFLDLPKAYQAFLFATINSNQRPVSKSLTYELFGYNVEDEPSGKWNPDKLAVFLSRKLNTEEDSALRERILIVAENDFAMSRQEAKEAGQWVISMATVVGGISGLISSNPKRDMYKLLQSRDSSRLQLPDDSSPLRSVYREGNDKLLYSLIFNYLKSADKNLWSLAGPESFITKTVGVQAVFDVLKKIAKAGIDSKNISVDFFDSYLSGTSQVDFSNVLFSNASGSGRGKIRRCIEYTSGLIQGEELDEAEREEFDRLNAPA